MFYNKNKIIKIILYFIKMLSEKLKGILSIISASFLQFVRKINTKLLLL